MINGGKRKGVCHGGCGSSSRGLRGRANTRAGEALLLLRRLNDLEPDGTERAARCLSCWPRRSRGRIIRWCRALVSFSSFLCKLDSEGRCKREQRGSWPAAPRAGATVFNSLRDPRGEDDDKTPRRSRRA